MKFSIVIPAFKSRFLNECINSVLAQTYNDFELIILNDDSPEDLDSLVYMFSDNRIRYYKNKKNVGAKDVVYNWNMLLDKAQGDYLICIGDDDVLLPNCLEEYLNLINLYPGLDIYHGWTEIIDEESKVVNIQEARPLFETVYSMMWHRWSGRNQYIGDFLFKVTTLKKLNGFFYLPLAWASDDLTTYIVATNKGIANTQVPVFQYRVNSLSISSGGNPELKLEAMMQEYNWYSVFLNKNISLHGTDVIYHDLLRKGLDLYFTRKKASLLRNEFYNNSYLSTSMYWMSRLKKYNLSIKVLMKAILDSVKMKYSS